MKARELKEKIQQLIDKTTDKSEKQKQRLNFLFRKLNEIQELEEIQRLKDYEQGRYLKAYLLYKSISRANYQLRHLKLTNFDNPEKLLEAINSEIENRESKKEVLPVIQPTNEQLL